MIRGSCRSGSRSRAISGEIASQPTNESISTAAARPIAHQPCGANGVQCSTAGLRRAPRPRPPITSTTSTPTSAELHAAADARPATVMASTTTASSTAASATVARGPPPTSSRT